MNPTKYNLFFFISVLYVAIMLFTNNIGMTFAFLGLLLICIRMNFDLGLAVYLLLMPLVGAMDVSIFLQIIYTIVVCIAFFIKIFNGSLRLISTNFATYPFLITLLAFLGMLFTGYFDYIHVLVLLILTLTVSYIIVQRLVHSKENVYLIVNALILAGVLATVNSFLLTEEESTRLRFGDNVRLLSNTVGASLMFLTYFYFIKRKITISSALIKSQFKIIRFLRVPIALILIAGLFATMSRGVMISLSVALFFLIIYNLFVNVKKFKLWSLTKMLFWVFLIGLIAYRFGLIFLSKFNIRTDLLIERFSQGSVESGTGIREKIWNAGYSGLEGGELIYGHGISSFQMLAKSNGYDYYAHSVFMDTLVTAGFLGLGVLILFFLKICRNIILNKAYDLFAFLIFLILAYFTHGTITSNGFWILLSIIFGLSFYQSLKKKRSYMLK